MGTITIDVLADLKKLQKQLSGFFKQKFQANVQGGGRAGGTAQGKDKGAFAPIASLLRGILLTIAPIAVLTKILDYFKVFDLIFAFIMTAVLQIWEWVKKLASIFVENIKSLWSNLQPILSKVWEWIKIAAQAIWDGLKWLWGFIKPILASVWEGIKAFGVAIWKSLKWLWSFIGPVLAKVWEWIKIGFAFVKEWGLKLWNRLKEVWSNITDFWAAKVQPILDKVWGVITDIFKKVVEMVSAFFSDPVGTLKKALQFVWDVISTLPAKIWDRMKELGTIIANAIKRVIPFGGGGGKSIGGGSSTSVTDALITKDGKVIRSHPSDNTIFTKNNTLGGSGGTTINLYGVTPKEMVDFVRKELGKQINKVGRY